MIFLLFWLTSPLYLLGGFYLAHLERELQKPDTAQLALAGHATKGYPTRWHQGTFCDCYTN